VNSLGLTEQQPENNVPRIVLEALGVTFSRDARARAIQLPAWNEALGLPHPWDQQWSLRIQQILAYETDLLEYGDLFEGSRVVEARTAELVEGAQAEMDRILALGGAFEAIEVMKARLVASQSERTRRIESGELPVVGVNRFTTTEVSPLGGDESVLQVDPRVEAEMVEDVEQWRSRRHDKQVRKALDELRRAAESDGGNGSGGVNLMPATIDLAHAGGTTGEWAQALREVWGEYRGPTGVGRASSAPGRTELAEARRQVGRITAARGGPPRLLVAKPGLDGHSNGAEQIAVAARDTGFEVVYQGIRQTPEQIAAVARDEDVDLIGLSILSGSHMDLVREVRSRLADAGVAVPVVVGGIVPPEDAARLKADGVAAVYTPKDYELGRIMRDLADLAEGSPD
ncbi:MAG TPA: methylmalonyl-CoA mutase family protein, partial [Acidimicrobiales bacterium]|nr:methylmalonyl-CoA mutase family protein [Acidimicrobiales bacterium]